MVDSKGRKTRNNKRMQKLMPIVRSQNCYQFVVFERIDGNERDLDKLVLSKGYSIKEIQQILPISDPSFRLSTTSPIKILKFCLSVTFCCNLVPSMEVEVIYGRPKIKRSPVELYCLSRNTSIDNLN